MRHLGNALAIVFGCMVAFLMAEAGLRLFYPVEFRVRGDRITLPENVTYKYQCEHYGPDSNVVVSNT